MNKVTTAALAGLMVVSAGAWADDARVNGFGAAKAFIADISDLPTLPGVIVNNPDTTYIELGQAVNNPDVSGCGGCYGGGAGGASVPNVDGSAYSNINGANTAWGGVNSRLLGGVLGVWYNRKYNALNNIDPGFTAPTTGTTIASTFSLTKPIEQIDLTFGYALSDATTIGIGINRATNSTKTETTSTSTTTTASNSGDFGISLGLEQKDLGPISLLEVGLQYHSRGDSDVVTSANTDKLSADGSAINLRVGGDMAGKDGMFTRIELGLNTQNLSLKTNPNTAIAVTNYAESKNSAMAWNIGCAMGGSKEKGMGLMGLMLKGLSQSRDEAFLGNVATNEVKKTNKNTLDLLASTAGEAKLNSWLTFRAGLESDLFYSKSTVTETGAAGTTTKVTTTNDAHAGTVADPNAKASMGITVALGDITIDGVLNQEVLYTGSFLASGVPGAVSSQVSLTWPWGGSKSAN